MALSAKAIVEIIRPRTAQPTEARGGRQTIRQLAPSGARSPFESNAGATPARVRTLPSRPLRSCRWIAKTLARTRERKRVVATLRCVVLKSPATGAIYRDA